MSTSSVILYHNPQSRSAGARALLEVLGAPYEVRFIDFTTKAQRQPEFLAINPMGKLPTIVHRGEVVTEQVAIFAYLADTFSSGELAPALDDPKRGPYLRWLAFYGSCFEPAAVDRAMKRADVDPSTSPYGDYDAVITTLTDQLGRGDYLLGDRLTAADVLWGSALRWTTAFGIVEVTPVIAAYIERVCAHPGFARATALDAELMPAG
jgi:glutathione S-transferase